MKQLQTFFFLLLGTTLLAALPSGPDMPCPFDAMATNYEDCASSCFGYYTECDVGACTSYCEELFSPGGGNFTPTDKCANVQCYDPYCDGNELVTCDCDETTGGCVCTAFWCAQGCDPATAQCIEKEIYTEGPGSINVICPTHVVLHDKSGENILHMSVEVLYPDGTPVPGAKVHVRLTDPKQTGVLGPWGFGDAVFFTGPDGSGSGDLEFPTLRNIKEYYWGEFPYSIRMDVTVSKHDNSEDWSMKGPPVQIELRSPAPRILEISINPNPAQSAEKHQVRVVVENSDSTELTYTFKNFGGKWSAPHTGVLEGSTDNIYAFTSSSQNEVLEWKAPARGLTTDEIDYAKKLFNIVSDAFLVNPGQAKINADAALERIEGEALSDEMSVVITVRDSDGFYDQEYYGFQMEYRGFKPEGGG